MQKSLLIICVTIILTQVITTPTFAQTSLPVPTAPPSTSNSPNITAQQQKIINDIKQQISQLQKEADYTESIKDKLPLSEYQAIISESQKNIQILQSLLNNLTLSNITEIRAELTNLKITTHVLRTLRLRRTAAILISYRDSLSAYTTLYNNFYPLILNSPLTGKAGQLSACTQEANQYLTNSNQFITGIFSQIGLISSIDTKPAAELDSTLRNQMSNGKKKLDQARNQLRTCAEILRP